MFQKLRKNLLSKAEFTDSELDSILEKFKKKEIPKKKFLLFSGSTCNFVAYILDGCMRSYTIEDDGREKVLQLAIEDYWISDVKAFLTNEPAELIIEAIEPTQVLLLYRDDLETLFKQIPGLEKYFRILYQNAYINLQNRLHSFVKLSAKERYLNLVKDHPQIVQRVPLVHLSSYIGATPETISRIRKELS